MNILNNDLSSIYTNMNTDKMSLEKAYCGFKTNTCKKKSDKRIPQGTDILYTICLVIYWGLVWSNMDGLVQERRNSIANALELHLSCTNPSIWFDVAYHITNKVRARIRVCTHKIHPISLLYSQYIDGLGQERLNSIAYALELCLSCTKPLIWKTVRKLMIQDCTVT